MSEAFYSLQLEDVPYHLDHITVGTLPSHMPLPYPSGSSPSRTTLPSPCLFRPDLPHDHIMPLCLLFQHQETLPKSTASTHTCHPWKYSGYRTTPFEPAGCRTMPGRELEFHTAHRIPQFNRCYRSSNTRSPWLRLTTPKRWSTPSQISVALQCQP